MIRAVVAMDDKRGIATERGLPWKIMPDQRHFRELTKDQDIIMGYATYVEFKAPLRKRRNYVWCRPDTKLREGFLPVYDLDVFFVQHPDSWVIGGATLFTASFDYCQELYVTHVHGDFRCTKFFPDFNKGYKQVEQGQKLQDGSHEFTYEVWSSMRLP